MQATAKSSRAPEDIQNSAIPRRAGKPGPVGRLQGGPPKLLQTGELKPSARISDATKPPSRAQRMRQAANVSSNAKGPHSYGGHGLETSHLQHKHNSASQNPLHYKNKTMSNISIIDRISERQNRMEEKYFSSKLKQQMKAGVNSEAATHSGANGFGKGLKPEGRPGGHGGKSVGPEHRRALPREQLQDVRKKGGKIASDYSVTQSGHKNTVAREPRGTVQ